MMFKNLPRYSTYRTTDEWIEELPAHWNWSPARTLFSERKVTGYLDEELLSVTIARGIISQSELLSSTSKKDSSNLNKSKYKLVEPGDLVYNKMRAWQGAAGGSKYRGIVSPAYVVINPRSGLTDYYHYLLRTPMFATEAERWSYGISSDQWSLRPEHFKMIRFPVPSSDEQAAIVNYLAHANARIDNAIAAKRRLISLLEEQLIASRETFIWNKGLGDPLRRIGSLGTFIRGRGGSKEDDSTSGIACLRYGDIYTHFGLTANVALHHIPFEIRHLYQKVEEGDVVLTASGETLEDIGKATVVRFGEEAVAGGDTLIFRPGPEIDPEFLALVLATQRCITKKAISATGSTIKHISVSSIRSIAVPLPDIQMQKSIVAEYGAAEAAFCHGKEILKREIELLQEFRTRLVADVVTGRVDVRAVAATLPDAPTPVVTSPDATTEEAD